MPNKTYCASRLRRCVCAPVSALFPSVCERAGVPAVCPQSLRGMHATLALEGGATHTAVAAALGHSSFAITATNSHFKISKGQIVRRGKSPRRHATSLPPR